jgi:hypothetical protein
VSATALELAAHNAAAAGVTEAIRWQRHDLTLSFPRGSFDLVSAHFLHSPVEISRAGILLLACKAVAPGGSLLVAGHAEFPSWMEPDPNVHFLTPDEVLQDLALSPAQWMVVRSDVVMRNLVEPDGKPGTRRDNIVNVRRVGTDERG